MAAPVPDAPLADNTARLARMLEAEWGHRPAGERAKVIGAIRRVRDELRRRAAGSIPAKPARADSTAPADASQSVGC